MVRRAKGFVLGTNTSGQGLMTPITTRVLEKAIARLQAQA